MTPVLHSWTKHQCSAVLTRLCWLWVQCSSSNHQNHPQLLGCEHWKWLQYGRQRDP